MRLALTALPLVFEGLVGSHMLDLASLLVDEALHADAADAGWEDHLEVFLTADIQPMVASVRARQL